MQYFIPPSIVILLCLAVMPAAHSEMSVLANRKPPDAPRSYSTGLLADLTGLPHFETSPLAISPQDRT
jgi:hypothetical protein